MDKERDRKIYSEKIYPSKKAIKNILFFIYVYYVGLFQNVRKLYLQKVTYVKSNSVIILVLIPKNVTN